MTSFKSFLREKSFSSVDEWKTYARDERGATRFQHTQNGWDAFDGNGKLVDHWSGDPKEGTAEPILPMQRRAM